MPPRGHRAGCQPAEHPTIGRRRLLEAGGLSLLGLGVGDLERIEALAGPAAGAGARAPRAKAVVFIFQSGGPSQHETWDPKPLAPAEVRGEYGHIATRTPELWICEYLPRLSERSDRYAIVRTMHHPSDRQFRNEHNAATYLLHTGTCELPPGETTSTIQLPRPRRFEWPSIGSMISYAARPASGSGWPPVIDLPRSALQPAGSGPGMLGARHARWRVDLAPECHVPDGGGSCPHCFSHDQPNDPTRAPGKGPRAWYDNSSCRQADFRLPDLGLSADFSADTLRNRQTLLATLDNLRRGLDSEPAVRGMDVYRQQALSLMLAQGGRDNPFDLSREPDRVRDLYGREEWGQAFLVARRLIEVGVRMVQVNLRGWDTHQNAFRDLKGYLLPSLDRCLSGFLDDLADRGMLDETLIVMCGEMGRTPRITPISATGKNTAGEPFTPGRHHWGDVFPCFFAGGGVQGGRLIGRTDRQGGVPASEAFTPAALAATIFQQLGIPREAQFHDRDGRPFGVYQAEPITALL